MDILIIGGTRHIGHYLTLQLLEDGHRVTLLNRSLSRDDLPADIPRIRCDRTDPAQLQNALHGKSFDVVVDTILYKGTDAEHIVEQLKGRVGHYIFLSTGQVYLVRDDIQRPFKESDYNGALIPAPEPMSYDFEEWTYGIEKRQSEDILAAAFAEHGFPYTSLRMPMVNGQRDTFHRLYSYMLRIKDGGPILVPKTPNLPLRHVYSFDVVTAIQRVIAAGSITHGQAYNISQDESLSLDAFLHILGDEIGIAPQIVPVARDLLEDNGFLPDCSPFSDRWMSELDNTLSKTVLGMEYTPVRDYIHEIVTYYREFAQPTPTSYRRRASEKQLTVL